MLLDGKKYSQEIKENLTKKVKSSVIKPYLVVIQIGDDEASNTYIRAKEKACKEVGICFKHIKFSEDNKEQEIVNKIIELNNDSFVNGILLQLPIPQVFNQNKLINLISKDKDVDGLTDINVGKLFKGDNKLLPCTPLGIMKLLEKYEIPILGKHAVVVGRSSLVGKPLAMLLLQAGATVTICHSKTNNLKDYTKTADILISAVGKKNLITADMIKEGSTIIDVGTNRFNGKLYGDVDFDSIKDKVSYITPVPGGVGPMTVAMLLNNVIDNYEKSNN
ncbi:MAG: bifunctional methylenetetrahydrofolate dehydrogenase/methenyltetrahydrofolate cyclohydrolase FolD [Bacilli bacterium]|nr:bifunctional methylenetetrahydrofolate dehydrogenase/methenyltetrahydrofolate cyclohydrolase FolD [Bacilli bacterium]